MWDLPRPGLEPVSPALAGRFSTTAPPGKPYIALFWFIQPIKITCSKTTPSESDRSRIWTRSFVSKTNFLSPKEEYPSWVGHWDNYGPPPTTTLLLVWYFLTTTTPPTLLLRSNHSNWPIHKLPSSSLGCNANNGRQKEGSKKERKKPRQYKKGLIQTTDQSILPENRAETLLEIYFLEAEPGLREGVWYRKRECGWDWDSGGLKLCFCPRLVVGLEKVTSLAHLTWHSVKSGSWTR